jgi:hypothetical protein
MHRSAHSPWTTSASAAGAEQRAVPVPPMVRAAAVSSIITVAAAFGFPARAADSWSTVAPGLRLLERSAAGPVELFVVEADLCAAGVSLRATASAERERTPSSFLALTGATAVINGDFFSYADYRPIGLAIGGGAAWSTDTDRFGAFVFGTDVVALPAQADVLDPPPAWADGAVGGYPVLVENGQAVTAPVAAPSHCTERHPRSALALSASGRTLLLVVLDGRRSGSIGATCAEFASHLVALGADRALNLDGGGSSALVLAGRGAVNTPSDGAERVVSNHLAVYARGAGHPGSCDLGQDAALLFSGALPASDGAVHSDLDGDGRADVCARGAGGLRCHLATGDGFTADPWLLPALADTEGFDAAPRWATIRLGDVTGDGRADVCARGEAGVRCWPSTGDGFDVPFDGPGLSDATGWSGLAYAATLQLADVTGDGRADLCARAAAGLRCWPSTGAGFGAAWEGPAWSDAAGFDAPSRFGTLRFGDLNGDGRADACIRGAGGLTCALAGEGGFGPAFAGPAWSDAAGFDTPARWASIALVPLDGDGHHAACARDGDGISCAAFEGGAFAAPSAGPALSAGTGWDDATNAHSLRWADIDADGDTDLCARADAGLRCWRRADGAWLPSVAGPPLEDGGDWGLVTRLASLRMADHTGDGRADACIRAAEGWRCWPAVDAGFGPSVEGPRWADSVGWAPDDHSATVRFASRLCRPELPNGRDDDCDGAVDSQGPDDSGAPADSAAPRDTGGGGGAGAGPAPEARGARGAGPGGCASLAAHPTLPVGPLVLAALALAVRRRGYISRRF